MKILTDYIDSLLSSFRWYRKKKGGTWYKIYDTRSDMGMASDTAEWVQERPTGDRISVIDEEVYPLQYPSSP